MRLLFSHRCFAELALAGALASGGVPARAQTPIPQYFLEGALTSQKGPNALGIALDAGANLNAVTTAPAAEVSGRSVRLLESRIGFSGATRIAAPSAFQEMLAEAGKRLDAGLPYKKSQFGNVLLGKGVWDIVFPGVIDPATGEPSGKAQNYFEPEVLEAERYYRAAFAVDPSDVRAAAGILQTYTERMLPQTFAGDNAVARSAGERLIGQKLTVGPNSTNIVGNPEAISREQVMLEKALAHYRAAGLILAEFASRPENVRLMEQRPPASSPNDANLAGFLQTRQALLETFARSLERQAENVHRFLQLSYQLNFESRQGGELRQNQNQSLIDLVDRETARLQSFALLLEPFRKPPTGFPANLAVAPFDSPSLATVRAFLAELSLLRSTIARGHIAFAGSSTSFKRVAYRSYSPEYVPFFYDPSRFDNRTTYAGLSSFALTLAASSADLDRSAQDTGLNFDQNLFTLTEKLNGILACHFDELGLLCGWVNVVTNNKTSKLPEIGLALLPPEFRDDYAGYVSQDKGDIGLQWQRVTQAEREVDAAILDLENTEKRIAKSTEIANSIAGDIGNLGQLVLENGEKLASLETLRGEIIARAAEARAQLEAQRAKRRSLLGQFTEKFGVKGLLAAHFINPNALPALAVIEGGGGVPSGEPGPAAGAKLAVSGLRGIKNAMDADADAKLALQLGNIDGDTARRLAEIAQQETLIKACESAAFQFQRQREVLYKNEEQVHSLLLEAERQKLNILITRDRLGMEKATLANKLGRVQFLLQEFDHALALEGTNPLRSPDYRLIRDARTREAEDMLALAQEWAFLTARSALYIATGTDQFQNINSLVEQVVRTRTGTRLRYLLFQIDAEVKTVTIDLGTRTQPMETPISLRDFVFQNNSVARDSKGEPVPGIAGNYQHQGAGNDERASNEAWQKFIEESYLANRDTGAPELRFTFALSLDRLGFRSGVTDPLQRISNPLWSANRYGTLITHLPNSTSKGFGVRINLKGAGITGISENQPITVELRQEGASYVRQKAWKSDRDGSALRLWNLGVTSGDIRASLNGFPMDTDNPQFHERSPANDRWVLVLPSASNANNLLLRQRSKIEDIEIVFSLSSFSER